LSGICLLLGVLETRAQTFTTNFWVQNVNATIVAYVQSGGSVISGTLPSKQFLTSLSGVTNLTDVRQTITNFTVTNLTVDVKNSAYLPPTNFPAEYDLNTNYVVSGFTNGFDFTNDIIFTQTSTNPVTYTFTNVVFELTNGQAVYLFPSVKASSLTAVLSTNSNETNVIFSLSGDVTNSTTTAIYGVFPDFKKGGAKLIFVTPIVHETLVTNGVTTNLPPVELQSRYMVRYSNGRTVTNVDVSACFSEDQNPTPVSTATGQLTLAKYNLAQITFDTTFPDPFFGFSQQAGTKIRILGFDFQTRGVVFVKGKVVSSDVLKTRRLSGGGEGQVNGQIVNKTFNQAKAIFNGSISFSVGHLESSL